MCDEACAYKLAYHDCEVGGDGIHPVRSTSVTEERMYITNTNTHPDKEM